MLSNQLVDMPTWVDRHPALIGGKSEIKKNLTKAVPRRVWALASSRNATGCWQVSWALFSYNTQSEIEDEAVKSCEQRNCGSCKIVLRASSHPEEGSVGDIVNQDWITVSKETKNNLPEAGEHSPPASSMLSPLEKAKVECEDLGFIAKTENYGECVLRLIEMD